VSLPASREAPYKSVESSRLPRDLFFRSGNNIFLSHVCRGMPRDSLSHEILYSFSLSLSLTLIAGTVTFSVPDFRRSLESALHRRAKSFLPQDVRRSDIRYLNRALSRLSDIVDILKIIS